MGDAVRSSASFASRDIHHLQAGSVDGEATVRHLRATPKRLGKSSHIRNRLIGSTAAASIFCKRAGESRPHRTPKHGASAKDVNRARESLLLLKGQDRRQHG